MVTHDPNSDHLGNEFVVTLFTKIWLVNHLLAFVLKVRKTNTRIDTKLPNIFDYSGLSFDNVSLCLNCSPRRLGFIVFRLNKPRLVRRSPTFSMVAV